MAGVENEKNQKSYETPIDGMECIVIDEVNCENNDESDLSEKLIIGETSAQNLKENSEENMDFEESKQELSQKNCTLSEDNLNESETDKVLKQTQNMTEIIKSDSLGIEKMTNVCNDNINAELIDKSLESNDCDLSCAQLENIVQSSQLSVIKCSLNDSEKGLNTEIGTHEKSETNFEINEKLCTKDVQESKGSKIVENEPKTEQNLEIVTKLIDRKEKQSNERENSGENSNIETEKNLMKNEEKSRSEKDIDSFKKDEKEKNTNESEDNQTAKDKTSLPEKRTKSLEEKEQKSHNYSETHFQERDSTKTKNLDEKENLIKSAESLEVNVKMQIISTETTEVDEDFEDELEGFDVIDSINDESIEDNKIEVIDLSDDN